MPSYEIHVLEGHVGGDATLQYTSGGVAFASFSIAVNDPFKPDDPPTWYRCTAWRALAETVSKYVHKGDALLVEGDRLALDEWTGQDGTARTTLALQVKRVVFQGKRDGDAPNEGAQTEPEPDELPF